METPTGSSKTWPLLECYGKFSATEVECALFNFPHYFGDEMFEMLVSSNRERKMPGVIFEVQKNLAN